MKAQAQLLSAHLEIAQSEKRAFCFNGIESGNKMKISETHYWNLKQKGLDGKTVELWCGADVVLADLNSDYDAIGTTRFFKSLYKNYKLTSSPTIQANKTRPDVLRYIFISDTCDTLF